MNALVDKLARDRRLMAYTAAAMYGGAALDGAIEGLLPGDPSFSVPPVIAAAAIVTGLVLFGPRLPRLALAALGPLGVVLIGIALAATPGAGDGAILYVWPALWSTFFFGRRGAVTIVACIGVTHAATLLALPPSSSYPGRWLDVMVSVCVLEVVVLTLVERNEQLLRKLEGEARTDALTGLLNRRGFAERAALELARARREGGSLALIALDVDHFKRINDEWGHEVGDRVLARIGSKLAATAREIDVVARFGGEEFIVLLPGCSVQDAHGLAERVRAAVAARAGGLPGVRISVGVAAALAPSTLEPLVHLADAALYEAKRSGRDRIVVSARKRTAAGDPSAARSPARPPALAVLDVSSAGD